MLSVVRGEPRPGQLGLSQVHSWDGALAAFLTYMLLLHRRFSQYYLTIVLCWFFSSRLLAALFNFYLPYVAVGVLTEALALFLIAAEYPYHPSKRLSLIFFLFYCLLKMNSSLKWLVMMMGASTTVAQLISTPDAVIIGISPFQLSDHSL